MGAIDEALNGPVTVISKPLASNKMPSTALNKMSSTASNKMLSMVSNKVHTPDCVWCLT